MSGILRLAASSSARTVLKPSAGLVRSAGIHRHALQQSSKSKLTASSSSKLFSRPSRAAIFPASSVAQQRAAYHDDGAYGYRVPGVYSMPDCKCFYALVSRGVLMFLIQRRDGCTGGDPGLFIKRRRLVSDCCALLIRYPRGTRQQSRECKLVASGHRLQNTWPSCGRS